VDAEGLRTGFDGSPLGLFIGCGGKILGKRPAASLQPGQGRRNLRISRQRSILARIAETVINPAAP